MADLQPVQNKDARDKDEEPSIEPVGAPSDLSTRSVEHSGETHPANGPALVEQLGVMNRPSDPTVGPLEHRQKMRADIVKWVFVIIGFTVTIPFFMTMLNVPMSEKHWEFLHIAFPAEIGLLTAAVAFYFDPRG